MFTAPLFTIARTWKLSKCPLTKERVTNMWYIYTMEYYSATKRNKIGSYIEILMDLDIIIISEVTQAKTNII